MSHELLIQKAKARLILDHPFFASILLSMNITIDESIPTMATDGENIRYNPTWVSELSLSETVFLLAHETMHCVFQHMHTRGDKDLNQWNIAADYVINQHLVDDQVGSMPTGGLLNIDLFNKGNGTTTGIYNLLPKNTKNKKPGSSGGSLDSCLDAGALNSSDDSGTSKKLDESTMNQKQSEMKVKIIQAKNAAKSMGKLSGGIERLIDSMTKTKTDWKAILRRFISEKSKDELSYSRPNRRFLGEDFYLPSKIGESMGSIAIAVDCSGSVDSELLAEFSAEINMIVEDTRPSEIKIVYFDSKVLRVDTIPRGELVDLKPIGGGGTAFSPIFETIDTWDSQPIACVVLTDMYCNDFGPCPDYPILWASTEEISTNAPFGELILIRSEK
jgi:predicted metal-dependent peptidase